MGAQGFNLGLRDALTLAELVETRGGDPGDASLLADHAQRREEDRRQTLAMSDGLARLTANDAPLLRPLRSLGLFALDRVPSAQSLLVGGARSEEHTSELQSLMRISYAVFCLKKKKPTNTVHNKIR